MTSPTQADPSAGPATVETVADWLKRSAGPDTDEAARLELVTNATNIVVRRLTCTQLASSWSPDIVLGATMLAGRLWRRRDTPAGVETFANDGAVYVQRNDPDVALLLGIGSYAPPRVG